MDIADKVQRKLDEYGIKIYNSYDVEKDVEHVFYTDCVIIFANRVDKSISLAFQATTKPHKVAATTVILSELDVDMYIMEDFIFNQKNEFISGDKAYELIEEAKTEKYIQEYHKQQVFKDILIHGDCHEC